MQDLHDITEKVVHKLGGCELAIYLRGSRAAPMRLGNPAAPLLRLSNLALGKTATQSSTAASGGPERARDGNTDGNFNNGSVTHTGYDFHAWWKVDLGAIAYIDHIGVYNRTDCCSERLSNFWVLVSDLPFVSDQLTPALEQQNVSAYFVGGYPATSVQIPVGRSGRYVRVQLSDSNYLHMAEVAQSELRVWGSSPTPTPTVTQTSAPTQTPTLIEKSGRKRGLRRDESLPQFPEVGWKPIGRRIDLAGKRRFWGKGCSFVQEDAAAGWRWLKCQALYFR